jgi:transketolase
MPNKRFCLRPRRGKFLQPAAAKLADAAWFNDIDLVYRTMCAVLFNYVPTSGHPGGSISSGRIVAGLLFNGMDYDFSIPDLAEADRLCYAAGHKALGLYAMWALRNELVRQARPNLLPEVSRQLRFEDLLGFRRNPTQPTALFRELHAKPLDGHPTPATPFVSIATGASGVGLTTSLGLALGAREAYGSMAPRIHILEGEGGMTPGRVHEGLSAAATMGLNNAVLHLDWNQASIDSDRVTAEGKHHGDYVQWDPMELLQLHDWNVIYAADGHDAACVSAAQKAALKLDNGQPTAVVYRTVKGWNYGIEGRGSHGAGHAFCTEGFYKAIAPFEKRFATTLPRFEGDKTPQRVEQAYWDTLSGIRKALESRPELSAAAVERLESSRKRLVATGRRQREGAPRLDDFYKADLRPEKTPAELALEPGKSATLRGALGKALGYINRLTGGAVMGCAADLLESTSVSEINVGFEKGFWHSKANPSSRLVPVGGICEDAMGGFMAGLASFGRHIGVTSSYAAFIGALEHVPARLHCIGQQARRSVDGLPFRTWIMVNAHAGPKTGEDGSTHADPQALQLLQNNFPAGLLITLTPWDPQELWPLMIRGLQARPAVLAPFVTRPAEMVLDRASLGLPPAHAAAQGVYALRRSQNAKTVVLQGSAVANAFVKDVLPKLTAAGIAVNVFYVASAELFDLLPAERRREIFSPELALHAMGITDFTLATMHRWIRSEEGLSATLHPFRGGEYLGSGSGERVLAEGGLDADSQFEAVRAWCAQGVPAA